MSGALAHYEHAATEAGHNHATAVGVKDNLYARVKAMQKEHEELNHPACSLPLGKRAAKLTEIANALPRLQTELRLSQQNVEQCEVKITETGLALQNGRISERNLRDRIARAEQQLQALITSELDPGTIALSQVRAERELDALREQYTKLVGEDEVPREAA